MNDLSNTTGLSGSEVGAVPSLGDHEAASRRHAKMMRELRRMGAVGIPEAAVRLQVKPAALFEHLKAKHWTATHNGAHVALPLKVLDGLLTQETRVVMTAAGRTVCFSEALVTPRGLARLGRDFAPRMA